MHLFRSPERRVSHHSLKIYVNVLFFGPFFKSSWFVIWSLLAWLNARWSQKVFSSFSVQAVRKLDQVVEKRSKKIINLYLLFTCLCGEQKKYLFCEQLFFARKKLHPEKMIQIWENKQQGAEGGCLSLRPSLQENLISNTQTSVQQHPCHICLASALAYHQTSCIWTRGVVYFYRACECVRLTDVL